MGQSYYQDDYQDKEFYREDSHSDFGGINCSIGCPKEPWYSKYITKCVTFPVHECEKKEEKKEEKHDSCDKEKNGCSVFITINCADGEVKKEIRKSY